MTYDHQDWQDVVFKKQPTTITTIDKKNQLLIQMKVINYEK